MEHGPLTCGERREARRLKRRRHRVLGRAAAARARRLGGHHPF